MKRILIGAIAAAGLVIPAVLAATAAPDVIAGTPTVNAAAQPVVFDLTGDMTLAGHGCVTAGSGYADISIGAQVVVTDEQGSVLGTSILLLGERHGADCSWPFVVSDVPLGHPFYGVEVTHRGVVTFTAAEAQDDARLILGNHR